MPGFPNPAVTLAITHKHKKYSFPEHSQIRMAQQQCKTFEANALEAHNNVQTTVEVRGHCMIT